MPETPSLDHCIKNTCFWYVLKQEEIQLEAFADVRKAKSELGGGRLLQILRQCLSAPAGFGLPDSSQSVPCGLSLQDKASTARMCPQDPALVS